MINKRKISLLISYKIKDGKILVYLQKRAKDAPRLPGYYGFFGGGKENDESPEETLQREIMEEMNFAPEGYHLLGDYEFEQSVKHIFILEVGDDFESDIKILEGEDGRYFNEKDALSEPKIIEEDKVVLRDLYKFLREQK